MGEINYRIKTYQEPATYSQNEPNCRLSAFETTVGFGFSLTRHFLQLI